LHIFIDESGVFKRDRAKPQAIACVGAAIIPGRNLGRVERAYRSLSEGWPRSDRGEIKGRLLGERHVAALCALLQSADVLFEASVMDMNLIHGADIDRHKAEQATRFTEGLTEGHPHEVARDARRRRQTLERMHQQLYAQAVALTDLGRKAALSGQIWFGRRYPGKLAHFRWVIDAKEKRRTTRYERWWRTSVAPMLQSWSLQDPVVGPAVGDGWAFRRDVPGSPAPEETGPVGTGRSTRADELAAVFGKDMVFATAQAHIGLQIADILTNALRRALMGHLQPAGWRPLGHLMIRRPEGAVTLLRLGPGRSRARRPYAHVIEELNRTGRSLLEQEG